MSIWCLVFGVQVAIDQEAEERSSSWTAGRSCLGPTPFLLSASPTHFSEHFGSLTYFLLQQPYSALELILFGTLGKKTGTEFLVFVTPGLKKMMLSLSELYDDDEDGEGEVYDDDQGVEGEVYDVRLEPWMSARHPDCDFSLGSKPIPLLLCEHTHNSTCCLYLHMLFRFFAQHWHDDAFGYLLKGVGGG